MISRIVLSISVVFYNFMSYSQGSTTIAEDDVPIKVVACHFSQYDGSTVLAWTQIYNEVDIKYSALINHGGTRKEVIYNQYGRIIQEMITKDKIPVMLVSFIEGKYEKYKILEFKSVKDFDKAQMQYQVRVKTKEHGEFALQFDDQFEPVNGVGVIASQF